MTDKVLKKDLDTLNVKISSLCGIQNSIYRLLVHSINIKASHKNKLLKELNQHIELVNKELENINKS
jgi:hypothetical protein